MMHAIKLIRPSNLVILAALPFIAYVFATSPDYQRAARAILGIEPGSSALVPGFILLSAALFAGLAAPLLIRRNTNSRMARVKGEGTDLDFLRFRAESKAFSE